MSRFRSELKKAKSRIPNLDQQDLAAFAKRKAILRFFANKLGGMIWTESNRQADGTNLRVELFHQEFGSNTSVFQRADVICENFPADHIIIESVNLNYDWFFVYGGRYKHRYGVHCIFRNMEWEFYQGSQQKFRSLPYEALDGSVLLKLESIEEVVDWILADSVHSMSIGLDMTRYQSVDQRIT